MKLRQAISEAALVHLDGMITNTACDSNSATVYIHACSLDGQETEAIFLADQEVVLDEQGSVSLTDIDGTEFVLTFYSPMKG